MTERFIAVKDEAGFYASLLLQDYTKRQREFFSHATLVAPGIPNGFYLNNNEIKIGYQRKVDGEWTIITEDDYHFWAHKQGEREDKVRRAYMLTGIGTLDQMMLKK